MKAEEGKRCAHLFWQPRRHGWARLGKLERLDPGRGLWTRVERIWGPGRPSRSQGRRGEEAVSLSCAIASRETDPVRLKPRNVRWVRRHGWRGRMWTPPLLGLSDRELHRRSQWHRLHASRYPFRHTIHTSRGPIGSSTEGRPRRPRPRPPSPVRHTPRAFRGPTGSSIPFRGALPNYEGRLVSCAIRSCIGLVSSPG